MPQIYDNIEHDLLTALTDAMGLTERADFCVGYFNLRGWRLLDSQVEKWSGGDGHCCRLLVGMQRTSQEQLRSAVSQFADAEQIDNSTVIALKQKLAIEFRRQLEFGSPNNADEKGLRRLAQQLKEKKLVVKLSCEKQLHAKLYLLFRQDNINPKVGYLGSSNLTFAGLADQGELNIDVLDQDACNKLAKWFQDRWDDRCCIDISDELIKVIENSWARETPLSPHHIYIKMAYHLSQEARAGLAEFQIPRDFGDTLFDFQKAAVKIAAHHLNKRGGVVIGDVVGLGKTLLATALARTVTDERGGRTLIICPKNLVSMWDDYRLRYSLHAEVCAISEVTKKLPNLKRFHLVVIDESHNLRNREGKRYRAIKEYINANDCKVVLLSATPYNKTYSDLSSQLRLFIGDDAEIGIRPERLLREMGEAKFKQKHQCSARSLAAFDESKHSNDWRDLMRLYLVRRTRSFIQKNYAKLDSKTGRKYLEFADETWSYFPDRVPKTIKFRVDENDANDQYGRLFADSVVETINALALPRYGLGSYAHNPLPQLPTADEQKILDNLAKAGKHLKGFCRTNLGSGQK